MLAFNSSLIQASSQISAQCTRSWSSKKLLTVNKSSTTRMPCQQKSWKFVAKAPSTFLSKRQSRLEVCSWSLSIQRKYQKKCLKRHELSGLGFLVISWKVKQLTKWFFFSCSCPTVYLYPRGISVRKSGKKVTFAGFKNFYFVCARFHVQSSITSALFNRFLIQVRSSMEATSLEQRIKKILFSI